MHVTALLSLGLSREMKAIVQEKYGSPDDLELREVAKPTVGDDDVLVRVRAASVHPDVWHVVIGRPYVLRLMGAGFAKPRNPIPGTDMAGIVESVGKGVTRFRQGDEVFGETIATHQWTNGGAFAEYVSVREDWLALKPGNVTFEQAAAVKPSGFIALHNLRDASQVRPGRKVLADEVIDYTREDFTRRAVRYDLIFDVPGNRRFSAFRRALTPDGKYIPIGHEHFGEAAEPGSRGHPSHDRGRTPREGHHHRGGRCAALRPAHAVIAARTKRPIS